MNDHVLGKPSNTTAIISPLLSSSPSVELTARGLGGVGGAEDIHAKVVVVVEKDMELQQLQARDDDDDDEEKATKRSRHLWLVRTIRQHVQSTVAQVPPKYKWICLFVWVAWKFLAVFLVYCFMTPALSSSTTTTTTENLWIPSILPHSELSRMEQPSHLPFVAAVRVLYIFTSTIPADEAPSKAMYRAIPLLRHNVATIVQEGFHVDVAWILERPTGSSDPIDVTPFLGVIRKAFPSQVGIVVWPDATPLIPDPLTGRVVQQNSQQHQAWWVIRDKFPFYHVFMVWPDTARILGSHVRHFWTLSQQLIVQGKETKSDTLKKYIPAFVSAFPNHANVPTANGTDHSHLRLARQEPNDSLHSSTQSQITWPPKEMRLGPLVQMPLPNNGTGSPTISGIMPTVVIPSAQLLSKNGFIISRSQLAEHGLLMCLFPEPTPIYQPFLVRNETTKIGGVGGHTCERPGPALLIASSDVGRHVVQFVRSSSNSKSDKERNHFLEKTGTQTQTVADFILNVRAFIRKGPISNINGTNEKQLAAALLEKSDIA